MKPETPESAADGRNDRPARPRNQLSPAVVLLAGLALWLVLGRVGGWWPFGRSADSPGALAVGEMAPPLVAAGWVNNKPPGDLAGRVVVVEAWAPW